MKMMNEIYEISKGIEMPRMGGRGGHSCKYPWLKMEIGDSFFVPGKSSIRSAVSHANKRGDQRWSTRAIEGGVRVWRVE